MLEGQNGRIQVNRTVRFFIFLLLFNIIARLVFFPHSDPESHPSGNEIELHKQSCLIWKKNKVLVFHS